MVVAEAQGGWGGSGSIFSSGSGHVTGVTSPNVVVGGGGERSRRSRRKDGGAVEEALPLLPPPLLPPPPEKPELEPQGVSALHHSRSHLPWPPGREAAPPPPAAAACGLPARAALRAPLPSSRRPVPAGALREHRQPGSRASGFLRAPPRLSHAGAHSLQVREGPAPRAPKWPGDRPGLSDLPSPGRRMLRCSAI